VPSRFIQSDAFSSYPVGGVVRLLDTVSKPDLGEVRITLAPSTSDQIVFVTGAGIPGLPSWKEGTYAADIEVLSADPSMTYTIAFAQAPGAGLIAPLIAESAALSGTGTKSFSATGTKKMGSANIRFALMVKVNRDSTGLPAADLVLRVRQAAHRVDTPWNPAPPSRHAGGPEALVEARSAEGAFNELRGKPSSLALSGTPSSLSIKGSVAAASTPKGEGS